MFGVICITPPAASVTILYPLPLRACAKVLGPGRQIGTDLRQLVRCVPGYSRLAMHTPTAHINPSCKSPAERCR
jgi:hypothetical protein